MFGKYSRIESPQALGHEGIIVGPYSDSEMNYFKTTFPEAVDSLNQKLGLVQGNGQKLHEEPITVTFSDLPFPPPNFAHDDTKIKDYISLLEHIWREHHEVALKSVA